MDGDQDKASNINTTQPVRAVCIVMACVERVRRGGGGAGCQLWLGAESKDICLALLANRVVRYGSRRPTLQGDDVSESKEAKQLASQLVEQVPPTTSSY